jgi:hypothetical protein
MKMRSRLSVTLAAASMFVCTLDAYAQEWKVAHWNVLHGWGRYWDNDPAEMDPPDLWPPTGPFSAISDDGSSPDGRTYGIVTGEPTGCGSAPYLATWRITNGPMQTLLHSADLAGDPALIAMTLSEADSCISGAEVKNALAAGSASWSGATVVQGVGAATRDALIAKHGWVNGVAPSTAVWPGNPSGDVAQINCTGATKYHVIHAHIYTDSAHTPANAVHLFATRIQGTSACETAQLDDFIRAKAGTTGRILMTGDFNFSAGSAGYNDLLNRGYTEAGTGLSGDATALTCCLGNDATKRTQNPRVHATRIDLGFYDNLPAATSYWVGNKSVPSTQEVGMSDHAVIKIGFPATTPPITTTVELPPSDDVFIRGGPYADTNFNDSVAYPYIATRAASTDEFVRKSLLKFDTTTTNIPAGSTIESAILYVTLKFTNTETRTISAFDVTESGWVEATVTWNNRTPTSPWATPGGSLGSARAVASVGTVLGTTIPFDVTSWVQTVVNGQQPGGSKWTRLALVDTATTGTSETYKEFHSKEASVATASKPRLVVKYR